MAGDLTHTERQPDLPAECQLLAISVLSSVARALKAGQFLASEAAGLTQHIRRRLRWKRPLHVYTFEGVGGPASPRNRLALGMDLIRILAQRGQEIPVQLERSRKRGREEGM